MQSLKMKPKSKRRIQRPKFFLKIEIRENKRNVYFQDWLDFEVLQRLNFDISQLLLLLLLLLTHNSPVFIAQGIYILEPY